MDIVSREVRSRIMSQIRGRDTKPEIVVRSAAHALGLRFRLGGCGLPGRPDLVFRRHAVALFVHGCFWHQHSCKLGKTPLSNESYWLPKLERNKARDAKCVKELKRLGWRVLVIWECQCRDAGALRSRLARFFGLTDLKGPTARASRAPRAKRA